MIASRPRLDEPAVERLALELIPALRPFAPQAVAYIPRGGRAIGETLSRALKIPRYRLDVHYPATTLLRRVPRLVATLALPLKELMYRLTSPRLAASTTVALPEPGTRLLLVDDSASSGRTIRAALDVLDRCGFDRPQVRVAVLRCGPRARAVVDHFAISDRVLFPTPGRSTPRRGAAGAGDVSRAGSV